MELFNIRGRWEKWKIGDINAANAPMPDCEHAKLTPMPQSDIRPNEAPMPESPISKIVFDQQGDGCLSVIFGFSKKR